MQKKCKIEKSKIIKGMENDNEKFKNEFKKRLYGWTLKLIKFISKLPKDMICDVMGRQVLRSGTSVLANYIEASSASSKKDFINFFTHSLKSANETKIWFTLLRDTEKGDAQDLEWLLAEIIEIANILASSILKLKGKR
ncbi:MAG: four helix bundle protein [Minisyncoccales bacterium]